MEGKNKKRPDGSIYIIHTYLPRAVIATQNSAARVALRWVGFSGCVRFIFFFPTSVVKCRCSHLITRNLFIDRDADAEISFTRMLPKSFGNSGQNLPPRKKIILWCLARFIR